MVYYTISAPEIGNLNENTQILLKDKFENILIDLTEQESYTFYGSTMDIVERFDLLFLLDPVGAFDVEQNLNVQVYAVNNTIFLRSQNANLLEGNLNVYDVLGRQIVSNKITGAYQYELPLDEQGIFIVSYFDNSERKEYRQKVYLK